MNFTSRAHNIVMVSSMAKWSFILVFFIAGLIEYDKQARAQDWKRVQEFDGKKFLSVSRGNYVELNFTIRSDIPRLCLWGYNLEIRDGSSQSTNLLGEFCGDYGTGVVRSSGRYMWLKFIRTDLYNFDVFYTARSINETVNPTLDQATNTQYVFLNRTSKLWCPVKGAPAPYIVWRKDGVTVQNSTSITFQLQVTSEDNVNYSCEVRRDGEVLRRNISLRIEECPGSCECDVFHQTIVSVNCSGKSFNSIAWKFPPAMSKLDISNNQLKELPSGIFSNNTKLSALDISNNQLKELPSGIFSNNTKLYYL
nr:uncharacterized protein LOC131771203 [Pocillopora verrucosa]